LEAGITPTPRLSRRIVHRDQFLAGHPARFRAAFCRSARACSYAFFNSSLCQVIVADAAQLLEILLRLAPTLLVGNLVADVLTRLVERLDLRLGARFEREDLIASAACE
jgi:hypothetical protein